MSWFLVNLMISVSDAAPFGGALGLLLGWIHMVIPFAILSAGFVGIHGLVRRF